MDVERLQHIRPIGLDTVGAAADRAAAAHPDLLRLENLNTDLRPPAVAVAATRAAVDEDSANRYLPFLGQFGLRQAIARHVGALSGHHYDAERNCVVTAGGMSGCLIALLALVPTGAEVIVTDPTDIGMLNRIRLSGGVPRCVPLMPDRGRWRLDQTALRAAVGPRTRAMFLMNPAMPTGAVLTADDWRVIAELCRERDLWLIYNAAMERILFDGHPYLHPAALSGMAERTVTVGSMSKEYRMIGWRVGWIVGPASMMPDIGRICMADVGVPVGIAQAAAAAALHAADADLKAAVAELQRRRDAILAELDGLPLIPAAGGWSMLLDVATMGHDATAAAQRLLEIGRVAVMPIANWGEAHGRRHVRLAFSNEPTQRLAGIGARVRRALT